MFKYLNRRGLCSVWAAFVFLGAASCGVVPIQPNPSNPIHSIAILPPVNASNNVVEPLKFQQALEKRLQGWHYQITPTIESNALLRDEFSLTLGKQLADFTPKELAEELGVSGLLYLYVFKAQTLGSKTNYQVGLKLVQPEGNLYYGRGTFVSDEVSGDALSEVINIANNLNHLANSEPLAVPTSKHPEKEMPGLDQLYLLPQDPQSDELGFLGGVALTAIKAGIGASFSKERSYALDQLLSQFPAGPGIPSAAIAISSSSTRHTSSTQSIPIEAIETTNQ